MPMYEFDDLINVVSSCSELNQLPIPARLQPPDSTPDLLTARAPGCERARQRLLPWTPWPPRERQRFLPWTPWPPREERQRFLFWIPWSPRERDKGFSPSHRERNRGFCISTNYSNYLPTKFQLLITTNIS